MFRAIYSYRIRRLSGVLLGLLWLEFISSALLAAPPDPGEDTPGPTVSEVSIILDDRIPGLMSQARIPGLSIAVVAKGQPSWTGAYGVMSMESKTPVTAETTFEAASLSKPVFALIALDAVERGLIDLDSPISDFYAYERFSSDPRTDQITPRMVLSHRSGLPNWDRDGALDLERDPGMQFGYSGEGYVYLQEAIEVLTGRSLNELAREVVFDPLGMNDSSFLWRQDYETRLAPGHDGDGVRAARNQYADENAAYSLVTTAADYGAFLASVMRRAGPSERLYDEMLAMQVGMRGNETKTEHPPAIWRSIHWGLGWGIQDVGGKRLYFHWGDNDVYHAFAAFSPSDGIGFVYFSNSRNGLKIAGDLAAIVVGDMKPTIEWLGYGR